MGGRGASSGLSEKGNTYGSQYKTLHTDGNIKFVIANNRNSEALFETMKSGRVYVTVGGNEILRVTYFDRDKKRTKQIDLKHSHEGMNPHTHHGYEHNERDSLKGAARITLKEHEMVDRVKRIWYNYLNNKS